MDMVIGIEQPSAHRSPTKIDRRAIGLAWGVIGGILVFDVGWLLAEALQGRGYSVAKHDVSDLAALTARYPWVFMTATGIAGAITIVFALFALRPALAGPARRASLGAWLLAASLIGLDSLSDAFFRLDCRAADAGCTAAASVRSWHGTIHLTVFAVSALATMALPFVLSFRMRRLKGWRDLASPAFFFGLLFLAVLVAGVPLEGKTGGGYLQRAAILMVSLGVVTLALRVRALARSGRTDPEDSSIGDSRWIR
jgi:Protein of unknown function (DUF998)